MLLDLYLWLWPRMDLPYLLKRTGYLMGLTVLFIGPLLYVNVDLIRKGFKPSQTSLNIEASRPPQETGTYNLPDDE